MKLIVQIPCLNEEETLPATLADTLGPDPVYPASARHFDSATAAAGL